METLELELQLWLHTVGACQSGWCIGGGIGIRWTFGGHWRTLVVDQPIYRHSLNIRWTLVVEQTIYRHSVNIATHLVPSNALGAHGNPLCRYFYLKISGSWSPGICSMQSGECSLVYTMHWCALHIVQCAFCWGVCSWIGCWCLLCAIVHVSVVQVCKCLLCVCACVCRTMCVWQQLSVQENSDSR